jgi:hypothetical protein
MAQSYIKKSPPPCPCSTYNEKGYPTPVPENSKSVTVAYQCECGKKWAFKKSDIDEDSTRQCTCGRTIVVHKGAIYGTRRK